MAAVKQIMATYSPEDITIILFNDRFTHQVVGTTEGEFITVTRTVPHAELVNGADGSNARVVRAIKNADITMTLMQTSETNDVLSRLLVEDEITRDGRDCFGVTIKDNVGRTVMSSPQAFIGTNPDVSFAETLSDTVWVIHAIHLEQHVGGNGLVTPDTGETLGDLGYQLEARWAT